MITSDPFGTRTRAGYFESRARAERNAHRAARGAAKQAARTEARKAATRAARLAAKSGAVAIADPYLASRAAFERTHPAEARRMSSYFNRADAVRVSDGNFASWTVRQLVKSTLYRIALAVRLNGATIGAAIAVLWDRSRLGEPPQESEVRRMIAGGAA